MWLRFIFISSASAGLLGSCSAAAPHPPALRDSDAATSVPPAAACVDDAAPPTPDAQGFCGNTFLKATADPPNLYFVIDHSGSMLETVDGQQKYTAVARAATGLVRSLGARANVGAALFPGRNLSGDNTCEVGSQVFPTRLGDLVPSGACGDGPVTRAFAGAIAAAGRAFGATPTAATLMALVPTLDRLSGKTAVVLATDGGPNCNAQATCDASKCIPNIENQCQPPGVNCCTDTTFGPQNCLDEDATRDAVATLFSHHILTYVIGIPGSSPYAALLDQLALAGGTARPMHPAYFDVEHLAELDGVLASIGATVALSCHLRLESSPPKRSLVNVYLDRDQLTYGSADGWIWSDDRDAALAESDADTADADEPSAPLDATAPGPLDLDLLGAACAQLTSGAVQQVQIVFGCPTAIIR